MQLLFCNTFNYDSTSASRNWAVVKFPCMVAVDLIKVIGLGVKAHSQLHDDQFIGKTAPGKFCIEIFSDDRSASMTTYEHVGMMDYDENSQIEFRPNSALYSEKLLLHGWFTRLTVAVYGGILSDISSSEPALELATKAPSLVIQEKPEGRSVYIRGVQELPQLTKDLEKPEPLMASFPSNEKGYLNMDGSTGRRGVTGYPSDNVQNLQSPYYDRRQSRPKTFNPDSRRMPNKNYSDDRTDYTIGNQTATRRKPKISETDPEPTSYRSDSSDRNQYKDRNLPFPGQNPRHGRHGSSESADSSSWKRAGNLQSDNSSKRDTHSFQGTPEVKGSPLSTQGSGEMEDNDQNQEWMETEYEEISDDETEEERLAVLQDFDDMVDGDDLLPASPWFNPFLMEPSQLLHYAHPGMNEFELSCAHFLSQHDQGLPDSGNEEDVARFESLMTKARKIGKLKSENPIPILILGGNDGKEWIAVIEEIIPLVASALPAFGVTSRDKYDEYLPLLVTYVFTALDKNVLSNQAIGFNLRMLKCGITLAQKLCETSQDIVAFLAEGGLDDKLLSVLHETSTASSIKIMAIHALDCYLSWPCGMNSYFLEDGKSNDTYCKLVKFILLPQAARVANALSRLMNKINLFHAMWKLRNVVQELVESKVPNLNDEFDSDEDFIADDVSEDDEITTEEDVEMVMVPLEESGEVSSDSSAAQFNKMSPSLKPVLKSALHITASDNEAESPIPLSAAVSFEDCGLSQQDIDSIIDSMSTIIHTFENPKHTIIQLPKRAFPTSADLRNISVKTATVCMFRMLEFFQVLPSIQILLSLPFVSGLTSVYELSYKFLDMLMTRQDGLLFLASNASSVICLAKHLLLSFNLDMSEVEYVGTAPHLGAKLAFHVQCIQCIDHIKAFSETNSDNLTASEECIELLKALHSLTFPTYGKYWTAHILSMEDNIMSLLGFVQCNKDDVMEESNLNESDEKKEGHTKRKTTRKTAAGGFAANLLLLTCKMSDAAGHLILHKQCILDFVKNAQTGRYIEEIHEWVRPLECLSSDGNTILQCMEFLKNGFSKLEWNSLMTAGPGLCTALRILCTVTGAARNLQEECHRSSFEDHSSALQVFAGGGLSVLVEGIEQLSKCYSYPCYSQHALTTLLSFNFHNLVTALAENLLILIRHLLNVLLHTNDGKFDPNLLTKLLIQHYAGIFLILRESDANKLNDITNLIISIYGIMLRNIDEPESATDIKEVNVRTKTLQHILNTTQEHCQNIVPGLVLFAQLLPMPLPFTLDVPEEGFIAEQKKERHLWASSLKAISDELLEFFIVCCQSMCLPLLEALIPLIQQVIDLSAFLARTTISAIVSACAAAEVLSNKEDQDETPLEEKNKSAYTFCSHPIMVLAEIIRLPAAKVAFLDYLKTEDNKLRSLWVTAQNQAKSGSPDLLDAAIKLVSVLVDPSIALLPKANDQTLMTTAFESDTLLDIVKLCCTALESVDLTTLIECLYCLRHLCMSDVCVKELKSAISANVTLLYDLLAVLVKAWDKDQGNACAALISFCDLIKQLCTSGPSKASTALTKAELRLFLNWESDVILEKHPLCILKSKIEVTDDDEESFEDALDLVTILYKSLKSSVNITKKNKSKKDVLNDSGCLCLEEQFELRPIHEASGADEFSVRFSILNGNMEASFLKRNIRGEQIKANLIDIAAKHCSGFNLEKSLKELTESAKATDIDKIRIEAKAKRLKKLETFSTRHGKTLTYIKRSHGLLMTGTRARGRGRGSSYGRQNDLFRQRKQNTSRPPSMHVDDFIAADEEDNNGAGDSFSSPPVPTPVFSTRRPPSFKREFVPRGRGNRGVARVPGSRGGYTNFINVGGSNNDSLTGIEKFRTRSVGSHPERFVRGRGRSRDPTRSFAPRGGFKPKSQQSWNFSTQRSMGLNSPGGFRGGSRVKSLMRIGRPLLPPPTQLNLKWGGMPPPQRRGRGYGKPRGKHIRSFTR